MTDQTKAITPYQKLKTLVSSEEIQERFRQILGEKAPGFLASVINTVYLNDYLREAEPNSVLTSALKAAVLDLPIDPNLGFAWIIPYKDHGKPIAQFQMGYKGYIQLALRSGQYQAINAAPIYNGEQVVEDRLTGDIKLNGKKISDEVKGYVAYFRLTNGFEKYWYMSNEELELHAKKYSKSYQYDLKDGKKSSLWNTNFDAMAKKTVLKLLISKYGIMSISMMSAFRKDDDDLSIRLSNDNGDEGEIVDTTWDDADLPQPEDENPLPDPPQDNEPTEFEIAAQLAEDGKIDHANHALNIIKKRKPDCTLSVYDFVVAYTGYRDMGATEKQAAEYANKGEMPK